MAAWSTALVALLSELATLTKNTVPLPSSEVTFEKVALPTPVRPKSAITQNRPRSIGLKPAT